MGGVCEENGCTVSATMLSALNVALVGAVQGSAPACTAGQNLVPGNTCGIDCTSGTYSSLVSATEVYSCPTVGNLVTPTIVCTACTTVQCASCPGDTCETCNDGYELGTTLLGAASCDPVSCPGPTVQVGHTFVNTGIANAAGVLDGTGALDELWFGIKNQGLDNCLKMVLADSRCAGDYFSYNTRGDGDCGCKQTGGFGVSAKLCHPSS